MIERDKLPQLFDLVVKPHWQAPAPTADSVQRINDHFKIALPATLIEFAQMSKHYGAWFASIGPDFESPELDSP